ncbi:MAG: hypothetical protein QM487_08275 [Candidatus Marithrix sp.]
MDNNSCYRNFFVVIANRDIEQGNLSIFLIDISILIFFELIMDKLIKQKIQYKKIILLILSMILLCIMLAIFAGEEIYMEYQRGGLF